VLSRHVFPDRWSLTFPIVLCGSSATSFLFLDQQTCNYHEVVCKHGGSHQQFESLATLGQTAFHTTTAEENGDPSLDAGPEALATLEGWAFLKGFLGWRFLPATLWNAHDLDASAFASLNIVLAEESPIGTVDARCITERFLVTLQRRFHVVVIRGITSEHAVLSDQTSGTFRNVDFVAEFYRFQDFASLDQVGVGFEDRKDLLFVRNLLSVKHAATCLTNDAGPKTTVMINPISKGLDRDLGHQIDAADSFSLLEHLARVSDHPLRGSDEFAIFRYQLFMPFFGRHSLDLLHPAPGAAAPVGESRNAMRKQVIEVSDQPGDDSHGVPQQGAVSWVVNVSLDNGRIDAQFLAVFQAESDSGFDNDFVDRFKRLWGKPVKSPVESVMLGDGLAVKTSESAQCISVCDPFSQFTVIAVFDPHQGQRAQHLLRGQPVPSGLGILQATLKIPAYFLNQVSVLVNKVGDRLQHRLQAHALAEEFKIGKTDLGVRGSCHFLAF
jgi:hypothetical protein